MVKSFREQSLNQEQQKGRVASCCLTPACDLRLPPGDADYPLRWSQIKAGFSRRMAKGER